jgi:hypothetical protein
MKLYDFTIEDSYLQNKLRRNVLNLFKEVSDGCYICKGYKYPLLARIANKYSTVYSPFNYMGSYTYNNEDTIRLHSTYGRINTYKKMTIFGLSFMVETDMSEEDAVVAAMTDKKFIEALIKALA